MGVIGLSAVLASRRWGSRGGPASTTREGGEADTGSLHSEEQRDQRAELCVRIWDFEGKRTAIQRSHIILH
jgi:hypothetical protein